MGGETKDALKPKATLGLIRKSERTSQDSNKSFEWEEAEKEGPSLDFLPV